MGSAVLWLIAPAVVGSGFNPVTQSISESAGQQTPHAWVARLSFVLLGVGAWTSWATFGVHRPTPGAAASSSVIPQVVRWGALVFGVGMIGAAVWSHAPWLPGVTGDPTADALHSLAASVAGLGIVVASVAALWLRGRGQLWWWLTAVCAAAFAMIPPLAASSPDVAGVLQRVMFVMATVWLAWTPQATTTSSAKT